MFSDSLQAPRFITQPSASGSIVAEGRTKILQCQALGRDRSRIGRSYFLALGRGRSRIGRSYFSARGRGRSRIGRSYFLALGRGRSRIGRSYS